MAGGLGGLYYVLDKRTSCLPTNERRSTMRKIVRIPSMAILAILTMAAIVSATADRGPDAATTVADLLDTPECNYSCETYPCAFLGHVLYKSRLATTTNT